MTFWKPLHFSDAAHQGSDAGTGVGGRGGAASEMSKSTAGNFMHPILPPLPGSKRLAGAGPSPELGFSLLGLSPAGLAPSSGRTSPNRTAPLSLQDLAATALQKVGCTRPFGGERKVWPRRVCCRIRDEGGRLGWRAAFTCRCFDRPAPTPQL